MSTKIILDRFTNQSQTVTGTLLPFSLPRLKPFLAISPGDSQEATPDSGARDNEVKNTKSDGEIRYTLSGHVTTDAVGRRTRRVKCIILGWFLLSDPETFEPEPYQLSIKSTLVLVNNESELPPLEAEAEDEDYVALGEELDIEDLVEEEILLDLPFWAIAVESPETVAKAKLKQAKQTKVAKSKKLLPIIETSENKDVSEEPKLSPFAVLAALKKGKAN